MSEHINRGCTNHGCVYHYVYPELAKGMHTNGPCHCNARPIADFLHRENTKLKSDHLALTEKHQREINGWADSLQQRERCIDELRAELAQAQQREARMRDMVRDAIGTVSDLICDWPKDLAALEIDKLAKWTHTLEEQP